MTLKPAHKSLSLVPAAQHNVEEPPPPLSDETVDEILKRRGLRGWLRAVRVAQVLGLLTLYLFLDTYDVRAAFNLKMAARRRDASNNDKWSAKLLARAKELARLSIDKAIRLLRWVVFRGHDGSATKDARLQKQAVWLRDSLVGADR